MGYVDIKTLSGNKVSENHPMLILDKITSDMPRSPLDPNLLELVKPYTLADPTFHRPGPVDVLLGGGLFPFIFTGEKQQLGPNLPFVMNTVFGYTLMGHSPCESNSKYNKDSSHLTTMLNVSDFDLHSSLQRYWQHEEPPRQTEYKLSNKKHLVKTQSREPSGKYCVRLPFKPNHHHLGNSSNNTKTRLFIPEEKFKTQPHYKEAFQKPRLVTHLSEDPSDLSTQTHGYFLHSTPHTMNKLKRWHRWRLPSSCCDSRHPYTSNVLATG
ncbi:uncharacterized protein LOC128985170 [Macrosteles quadrilineatus]|uniref:uncharacterized protein LOC128985170 n=1 Tax=Macrosteles quadrilineatus TaxID=74068 RepID=UPI0023E24658|nr:uncharacterized protein LOC128985170 [Macrosteles quadrilineatus]